MRVHPQPAAEQPTPTALARPLGPNESSYATTAEPGGWTRFEVTGARGPAVFWPALLIAPLVCAWLAHVANVPVVGALFGFVFGLIYVLGRHATLTALRRRRTPAGVFSVSAQGVRLATGAFVPAGAIRRLVVRNAMSGHITTWLGGSGAMGAAAAIGAARQAREAAQFETIAYQVELEAEGRAVPLVGEMTAATAQAVLEDMAGVLGMVRR